MVGQNFETARVSLKFKLIFKETKERSQFKNASSAPGSRAASPSGPGGGEPGSGGGGSVSLTPRSPVAPGTSTAATDAVFAALPSCLMPEAFTGKGRSENLLQQFTTTARLFGWQTATTDNRLHCFAHRFKGNALHFFTKLTVAEQKDFDQIVAALGTRYTASVEVLIAKFKAAKQQPNHYEPFQLFCIIRTLAKRVKEGKPGIEEKMDLVSFLEGLYEAQQEGISKEQTSQSTWCSGSGS